MSLQKSVVLMELIDLVSLVIRELRDLVGIERVERITLWSEIGEKVWFTAVTRVEVDLVMRRSSVWPEL